MRHLPTLILIATLSAFAIRGVLYFQIGSWLPLVFALVVMALLFLARGLGRKSAMVAVRVWGGVLVLYGLGRIALAGLLYFAQISSPHAMENTGWIFVAVSGLYLAAGIYLFISWRDRFSLKTAA